MTNEQSIKIIRELLVEIDNGGVLCSEKEREELKAAIVTAIKALKIKYTVDLYGNICTLVPHGKWENLRKVYTDASMGTCSCCGERVIVGNFCPNCGANMREGDAE
jgi:hypothetical protein